MAPGTGSSARNLSRGRSGQTLRQRDGAVVGDGALGGEGDVGARVDTAQLRAARRRVAASLDEAQAGVGISTLTADRLARLQDLLTRQQRAAQDARGHPPVPAPAGPRRGLPLGSRELRRSRFLEHRGYQVTYVRNITDIDDNRYVDYRMGYGPGILGYADPRVDEAARAGMEVGGVFALSTEREYEVAKRISKMVPSAELVRFSNSGTEAVMAALRLARAHTGKDAHIIVEGGYHGVFDAVLWYAYIEEWDPDQGRPPIEPEQSSSTVRSRALKSR